MNEKSELKNEQQVLMFELKIKTDKLLKKFKLLNKESKEKFSA